MSSFFDDASLVMIPSGYKDQKVYSVKPTDGTGDLTFSRASDATRVQSDGLIEKVRTNLLLQSNTLNTTWTTPNVSVTGGQTDPDGGLTAWLITETVDGGSLRQAITATGSLTFSFTLKANTGSTSATLFCTDASQQAAFDLSAGTFSESGATAKMVSLGNGWWRCSISFTASGASTLILFPSSGVAVGSTFAYEAQLETGDIATDYIATTTASVSVGPVSGLPRLDYLGSTCPRLLLEPQRTNNVTYSEQLDNAAWTFATAGSASAPVVTANYGISPSGYQDAERVQFSRTGTTASDYSLIDRSTISTAAGVVSFYGKSLSGTQSILLYYGGVGQVFTLTTEWQRFSLYNPTTTTDLTIGTRGGTGSYFNGGSLTIDCLLWGFQKEAGAYATSYIPTLGASVTRVADAASKTGISSLIGQTEGTIFWEGSINTLSGSAQICDLNADGNKYIQIYNSLSGSTPTIGLYIQNVSVLLNIGNIATLTYNTNFKFALGYKNNDYAAYLNGVQVYVNTTIGVPPTSNFGLGKLEQAAEESGKKVSQALLFKTRLTNAQLAELTA
jgi:hypothetical protein